MIGVRLDADIHGEACRLAFYGRIVCLLDPAIPTDIQKLRVFKVSMIGHIGWTSHKLLWFPPLWMQNQT